MMRRLKLAANLIPRDITPRDMQEERLTRKRPRNGFSLIEVLIAIGVIAVGVLALLAVFITGTRSNEHGAVLSDGIYYARKITEFVRANNLAFADPGGQVPPPASSNVNDPDGVWRALDASPMFDIRRRVVDDDGVVVMEGGVEKLVAGDDKFERHIEMERASNNAADYNYNNVVVDVSIRWKDGKTTQGYHRVNLQTLVRQGS